MFGSENGSGLLQQQASMVKERTDGGSSSQSEAERQSGAGMIPEHGWMETKGARYEMKARFGLLVVGLYLSIAGAALSQTYNSYADFSDTQGPVWYYMRCNTSGDGYTGSYGECAYVIDSPPYWGHGPTPSTGLFTIRQGATPVRALIRFGNSGFRRR